MSEMVDKVGSAIQDAVRNHGSYTAVARAAIEALRDPTEAMIIAGVHHDNMGDMAGRWRAMIDAALKGE